MGIVRRRVRRRALLAGGAAYAVGKRRGRNQETQEQGDPAQGDPEGQYDDAPPDTAPPAPSAGGSDADELQRLATLHDAGTLTDAEFSAAKAKVLGI